LVQPRNPLPPRLLREPAHDHAAAGNAAPVVQRETYAYQTIVDRFQPGDLMYGLSGARTPTVKAVRAKQLAMDPPGSPARAAAILDELNNVFLGTFTRGTPYGKRRPGAAGSGPVSQQAAAFKLYLEAHPKYSPLLHEIRGKPLVDGSRAWERIKKSCKAGLVYTTEGGHQIYFILDDLDVTDVVHKLRWSGQDDPLTEEERALKVDPKTQDAVGDITGAELRSLYRLRGDPAVMGNVTFWKGGAEESVDPPWVEDSGLWDEYVPKREQMHGADIEDDLAPGGREAPRRQKRRGLFSRFFGRRK
jgi:hypothetical protein